jgi:hypothetical protein
MPDNDLLTMSDEELGESLLQYETVQSSADLTRRCSRSCTAPTLPLPISVAGILGC